MAKISKINSQPKPPTIQFHQVIFRISTVFCSQSCSIFRISAVLVVHCVLFLEL